MENTILLIALVASGFLGSWFSIYMRDHSLGPWVILMNPSSWMTSFIWWYITRYKQVSLAVASVVFDVILGMTFFIGFLVLREPITVKQFIGCVLALTGIVLIGK